MKNQASRENCDSRACESRPRISQDNLISSYNGQRKITDSDQLMTKFVMTGSIQQQRHLKPNSYLYY